MTCSNRNRNLLGFAVVAMVTLLLSFVNSAQAGPVGQLGVFDPSLANGGINPATGSAWAVGDQYRLAFVSAATRDATDPNISAYNLHLQTAANANGLGGATWRTVGRSFNNTDVRVNSGTVGGGGSAIYLVDGVTQLADNNADLWNGSIDNLWNVTETGGTYSGRVATGSSRTFGDPGQTKIEHGLNTVTDGRWFQQYNGNQTDTNWHFYAISDPLTLQAGFEISGTATAGTWTIDNGGGAGVFVPEDSTTPPPVFPGVNSLVLQETANDLGPFDVEVTVDGSFDNGTETIAVSKQVTNDSGFDWARFQIELGTGVGDDFVASIAGDGLSFLLDPAALEDTGAFTEVVVEEDLLTFMGLLEDGATADFLMAIEVPEGTAGQGMFTLRQSAVQTPEPTSIAIWSLLGLALGGYGYFRARRKSSGRMK